MACQCRETNYLKKKMTFTHCVTTNGDARRKLSEPSKKFDVHHLMFVYYSLFAFQKIEEEDEERKKELKERKKEEKIGEKENRIKIIST